MPPLSEPPKFDLPLIEEACRYLAGRIRRTPLEPSPRLSQLLGVPVLLKLECLQITGSFKLRGALFRLSRLSRQERARGVATCSAGNHGKAVAWAAARLGLDATIYVPASVDQAKLEGMLRHGAQVIKSSFEGYDRTEAWAREQAATQGLPFISAFEDDAVMAGNGGSLAQEILQDAPDAQHLVIPVGGGGLGAGLATWLAAKRPEARILACQHQDSPALALSLERGTAVTRMPAIRTLAGGIEGGIGARCFELLRPQLDGVALLSEEEILQACTWLLDQHQYLVEPSGAATVAACRSGKLGALSGTAVVVLSGRNMSLQALKTVLASRT